MRAYTKKIKRTAWMLLAIMSTELIYPNVGLALTSGPSQPEVQSFEPVGTSDMVDMFSGDFVYNIPLLDVEGYPVNIAYHGGVTMEQEASWVGLGWNINPGVVNRSVRGVPDDFNGDSILKQLSIKDEKTFRIGASASAELLGIGDPVMGKLNVSAGYNITISNYRGVGVDYNIGANLNLFKSISTGVNLGIGSQSGADIDYNYNVTCDISKTVSEEESGKSGSFSYGVGGGYNSRSGLKDLSFSYSYSKPSGLNLTDAKTIPIGVHNVVPVITNSSVMNAVYGRIKLGGAAFGALGYGNISGMYSTVHFNNEASRSSYGYMYLQNAKKDNSSILDFTRDKDGQFNRSMQYLPIPSMTYDIYSGSGQGIGGAFRPYRNDFGSVYDPQTESSSESSSEGLEVGVGNIAEAGLDHTETKTKSYSGPWNEYNRNNGIKKGFVSSEYGSVFENLYFKQAGELAITDSTYTSSVYNKKFITPTDYMNLSEKKNHTQREPRANLIQVYTAQKDSIYNSERTVDNYSINSFSSYATPSIQKINKIGRNAYQRKRHHISRIIQTQKDGKKYVYGIAPLNNIQREYTVSVDPTSGNYFNTSTGMVSLESSDLTQSNHKGQENYYSSSITPAFSHSYLLTSVLSNDYVDVKGDGVSDDDLGSYTKFNYSRTDSDYRWVAPYSANVDSGQYNPGFWSNKKDDKANLVIGSREQWYLRSIETKNYIAEFYVSPRADAKGVKNKILFGSSDIEPFKTNKSTESYSYKLDSIVLYNKHDRFINQSLSKPIKTVYFTYNYSLCDGTPNNGTGTVGNRGKLTLTRIAIKNGTSKISMVSPYRFEYGYNPNYSLAAKDRWGNYKPSNSPLTNYEYPYVEQDGTNNNLYANAWTLNKITLPSGGIIQAEYESDDYAYVQDKVACEMSLIAGVGNSQSYAPNDILYSATNSSNEYLYFKRKLDREKEGFSIVQNYLGVDAVSQNDILYYNCNIKLNSKESSFEQMKGYARIKDIGVCPNNAQYIYVRLGLVQPKSSSNMVNPITYTSINSARYNIPQIMFPGMDVDESDLQNVLTGLKGSLDELANIGRSPIVTFMDKGYCRTINLAKSFIRINAVGMKKYGGGQRVKKLTFSDEWDNMNNNTEPKAKYGKTYDYTIKDPKWGKISSGVASYEPMIGGDENPFRKPVEYTAQSASNFPPNDPVILYQETPLGETLYPSASVGYSSITVKSIHAAYGKSSQGVDKYEFYTAKDFPVQVAASTLIPTSDIEMGFFDQKNISTAKQTYSLILNDMHGKPKKTEHLVYQPESGTYRQISYQLYNYRTKNNLLDNNVPCFVYQGGNMVVRNRLLGVEEDLTLDTRYKGEYTNNTTANVNVNCFVVGIFPVVVPFGFTWHTSSSNEFKSAVVSKIVQQYGIIDNVISSNEGTITKVQNEVYDGLTGQPLVTSVTNEYQDKEYSTTIPAYWVYKGMGPGYLNMGYTDTGKIEVNKDYLGKLLISNSNPIKVGDELYIQYKDAGLVNRTATAWVVGKIPEYRIDSVLVTETVTDTIPFVDEIPIYDSVMYFAPIELSGHHEIDKSGIDSFYDRCSDGSLSTLNWRIGSGYGVGMSSDHYYTLGNLTTPFSGDRNVNIKASFTTDADYSGCANVGYTDVSNCMARAFHNEDITLISSPYGASSCILTGNISGPCAGGTSASVPFNDTISCHHFYQIIGSKDTTVYTYETRTVSTYQKYSVKICDGLKVLPRNPQSTDGWSRNTSLTDVKIEVVNSGGKNMLNDVCESYTSMSKPYEANRLNHELNNLISLKAFTYSDSNTAVSNQMLVSSQMYNPYVIGQRGIWRPFQEYSYLKGRNYTNVTARNSGLFNAVSLLKNNPTSTVTDSCSYNPFNYLTFNFNDKNWGIVKTISKYSPEGLELENIDAVGNYSSVIYSPSCAYPIAVGYNVRQGEYFYDGFEDYSFLIHNNSNLIRYSPFNVFALNTLGSSTYSIYDINSSSAYKVLSDGGHTGKNYLKVSSESNLLLPISAYNSGDYYDYKTLYNSYYPNDPINPYRFSGKNEVLPFKLTAGREYIMSLWYKDLNNLNLALYPNPEAGGIQTNRSFRYMFSKKTSVINGWQLAEVKFKAENGMKLALPKNLCIDDVRLYPADANMKSFVYNPYDFKLLATLDENNFATVYQYDNEGKLIRTNRETTSGFLTVSESRSGNKR